MRALGAAVLAVAVALLATAGAGAAPNVGGCSVFPDSSGSPQAKSAADQTAWNQDITKAPVHKRSKRIVRQINRDGGTELHPDFGGDGEFGIPFEVVPAEQPDVTVTIGPDGFPDESDFGQAPIPPGARIEGGPGSDGDRHVIVLQQGGCGLYELYRAFPQAGGNWQADSTARFDLNSPGPLRPAGSTSADAAGLPIFPGLVRFDEVAAGRVEHAIRITFDETREGYIPPATHHASDSCNRNRPPMGMRLRLKGGYFKEHLDDFPQGSQSRPIFEAFRHYGVINADNGSNWFFQGSVDTRWDDDDLGRLKDIPGGAFQVVKSAAKERSPC
ncbi:MAG TPA: hypothetical protein VFY99_02580 [Solirubrobacterales bacterium]